MNRLIAIVESQAHAGPRERGLMNMLFVVALLSLVAGCQLVALSAHGLELALAVANTPNEAKAKKQTPDRDDATDRALEAAAADNCDEVVRITNDTRVRAGSAAATSLERGKATAHCFLGRDALLRGIDEAVRTADCTRVRRLTKRLGQLDYGLAQIQRDRDVVRACLAPTPASGPAVLDPSEPRPVPEPSR